MSDTLLGAFVFGMGLLMHVGFWWNLPRIREGEVKGQHGRIFLRADDPVRYWMYVGLYIFGAFLGLFMMFWGAIGVSVGLGVIE